MDSLRLHTDTILNVLLLCNPNELSVFVAMDHMASSLRLSLLNSDFEPQDWYKPSINSTSQDELVVQGAQSAKPNACELTKTIKAIRRALKVGGRCYWRSAALFPWYCQLFKREGFEVTPISVRFHRLRRTLSNL